MTEKLMLISYFLGMLTVFLMVLYNWNEKRVAKNNKEKFNASKNVKRICDSSSDVILLEIFKIKSNHINFWEGLFSVSYILNHGMGNYNYYTIIVKFKDKTKDFTSIDLDANYYSLNDIFSLMEKISGMIM